MTDGFQQNSAFSEPEPDSNICEKPDADPQSFNIFGSRSLRGLHKCHRFKMTSLKFG